MTGDKTAPISGPASYFPAIEARYGRPIVDWLALVQDRADLPHMQVVAWLKTDHGMGHGHANAIVAHVRAARTAD
ncbi:protein of unknown function [Loktanella fryxellensis]|uniref:DUF4287 domain-containing protein n=1 Tax=Loktanella fryxellensis TaxID=245187 RepID=A0A1H8D8D0_9RHOB|nr:DUF4287 domain-containing protein [Loktanella fryxellensis]SEN03509.1 protein of unknown function [Loktanella fryxellensis]